jgi:hypothetical protein
VRPADGAGPAGYFVAATSAGHGVQARLANLKAELWWRLRCRFEKAYEHVTQEVDHPPEDMISIVDHPQLIAELSLPSVEYTENGKIRIESKEKLRRRGVKSPDFTEALVLSEAAYAVKDRLTAPLRSVLEPPRLKARRTAQAGLAVQAMESNHSRIPGVSLLVRAAGSYTAWRSG